MVEFIKDGNIYDIEFNSENYGTLEFDATRSVWVLWYPQHSEGVDYFEDLEETKQAIKDELEG